MPPKKNPLNSLSRSPFFCSPIAHHPCLEFDGAMVQESQDSSETVSTAQPPRCTGARNLGGKVAVNPSLPWRKHSPETTPNTKFYRPIRSRATRSLDHYKSCSFSSPKFSAKVHFPLVSLCHARRKFQRPFSSAHLLIVLLQASLAVTLRTVTTKGAVTYISPM